MKYVKPSDDRSATPYISYIVGFLLSIITTLLAYYLAVSGASTPDVIVFAILTIAVGQLVVQMIFFLHIGQGSRWKLLTFIFTAFFVLFLVIGTVWVMHHLNYNMMDMSTDEMRTYMEENQGL